MERRKMLNMIGLGGLTTWSGTVITDTNKPDPEKVMSYLPTFEDLIKDSTLKPGDVVTTMGYYQINDGGAAQYQIKSSKSKEDATDPGNGTFPLNNELIARLINVQTVNYQLFGAMSNGKSDDGKAILAAHQFANENQLPVENLSGQYWITKVRNIPMETNVRWGQSVFHIDEKHNTREPVFHVKSRQEPIEIPAKDSIGQAVIEQLKPGVQVIQEMEKFKNHLIHLYDDQDRIAFRAGNYSQKGRAREELVYVSQEGRILGDVAWTFKPTVTITAYPAEHSYLLIEGGTLYLSGENPVDPPSMYTHNGILVTRSRTRIRRQWVGIEPGKSDDSMTPQSGFYYFMKVYDVQLEDIRLIPREKNRPGDDKDVPQGTYGIGGNRVLEFNMTGVVAEGTGIHWGVLGTNMMKNVSLRDCRINRFDVHFHLWNLTIRDSEIGHKGITVTGGGKLHIENTTCFQHRFINFRRDYGAKWEGDIYLSNCVLKPPAEWECAVLYFVASDFEYGYPIGMARSITVKDMVIDYGGVPGNDASCWLIRTSDFSVTSTDERLFFPSSVRFEHIRVAGREQGIRVVDIKNPSGYQVAKTGRYDGDILQANSDWVLDDVDLESINQKGEPSEPYHIVVENQKPANQSPDEHSPYLSLTVRNCRHFAAFLAAVPVKIHILNSKINRLVLNDSAECEGEALFDHCDFVPAVSDSEKEPVLALDTTLGTTFTNCVIHLPTTEENIKLDQLSVIPFIEINKSVKYNHINTRLSNGFELYLMEHNFPINKDFKEKLMLHSG